MTTDAKKSGAYYTPREMAAFLVDWAVRSPADLILDPGFGEAVFLAEAYRKLTQVGADPATAASHIYGVELDPGAHERGRELLEQMTGQRSTTLLHANFFELGQLYAPPVPKVDVIIGNPPYIRYQLFQGSMRALGLKAAAQAGVHLSQLTSAWAPYLVHAVSFLHEKGRLAMVVPAELLHVSYARSLREFLLKQFQSVTVITFEERIFPGVLEDTALLLADRQGQPDGLRLVRLHNLDDLSGWELSPAQVHVASDDATKMKWVRYLLSQSDYNLYTELTRNLRFCELKKMARVDIGVVTGNNAYFLLAAEDIERWQIEPAFYQKAIHRAADISGACLSVSDWEQLRDQGRKCYLLTVGAAPERLRQSRVWSYINQGAKQRVPEAFKCRMREPWYAVPSIYVPDVFLTYMSYTVPRLVLNEAQAISTNTIHRVMLKTQDEIMTKALVVSFYNTLTMLSAELTARSYGGGVLKLEPSEAESIQLPPLTDKKLARTLAALLPEVDRLLRAREVDAVLHKVDEILFHEQISLNRATLRQLTTAYRSLRDKRLTRTKPPQHVS